MSLSAELAAINDFSRVAGESRSAFAVEEGDLALIAEFGGGRVGNYAAATEPIEERRQILRQWKGDARERIKGMAIFTDTTTLYAAHALMSDRGGQVLSAPTLLDLDTFIRCAVLYDQIVCLQPGTVPREINEALGEDVVIPIVEFSERRASPRGGIAGALADLFDEVSVDLWRLSHAEEGTAAFDDAKELCRNWELLLGIPVQVSDLDGRRANRNQTWASAGMYNVRKLVSTHRDDAYRLGALDPDEQWIQFIDECNIRALFNIKIAQMLDFPYAANSTRLPLRFQQIRNAVTAHDCFLDIAEIQRYINERTRAYLRPHTVQLPVLLTAAIEKAGSPNALWEQVARLRREARRYRERRAELLDALAKNDVRAIKRLEKALGDDGNAFSKVVGSTAEIAVNAFLLATGQGLAFIIVQTLRLIKALSSRDSDAELRLLDRVARGDQWFVTKLGKRAEQLLNGFSQVEQLWHPSPIALQICAARLERMRELQTTWPTPVT